MDLHDADHERGWRRLRAIPGIGPWTVEMLALHGQGRYDQVPAGDLGLLKHVGRLLSGGDPRARAGEEEVRAFFARYGALAGLAAVHIRASRARSVAVNPSQAWVGYLSTMDPGVGTVVSLADRMTADGTLAAPRAVRRWGRPVPRGARGQQLG